MQKEVIVKLKGEDKRSYKLSFNCYAEGVIMSELDPILSSYVQQAKDELKVPCEECEVIIKMIWT